MAVEKKARKNPLYLTYAVRALLALLGAFIIRAYFYPISGKFYFTSSDELMHFTGFIVLGFLFALAFAKNKISHGMLFITLFGIALELAQPVLTASRKLSVSDMMANAAGGIIGYGLGALILYLALKRSLSRAE